MKFQADGLKKRGSVKAETSLSAVEMSGKVIKRGYLLKQVTAALLILQNISNKILDFIIPLGQRAGRLTVIAASLY